MLSCKQTSELISARYDRRLSLAERVPMRLHLIMCRYCSAVARQIAFIQKLVSQKDGADPSSASCEARLPQTARDRINEKIRQAGVDPE